MNQATALPTERIEVGDFPGFDVVNVLPVGDALKIGLGPAIAVIGIIATFYYFYVSNKRKKVLIDERWTRLIASRIDDAKDRFEITFDKQIVQDPYLFELKVVNIGRKDVASKDFDGDTPVTIKLKTRIVAPMEMPESDEFAFLGYMCADDEVQIEPTILPVDRQFRARILVDGKPDPTLPTGHLLDTDIIAGEALRSRIRSRRRRFFAVSFILYITTLALFIWAIAHHQKGAESVSYVVEMVIAYSGLAISAVMLFFVSRMRRSLKDSYLAWD